MFLGWGVVRGGIRVVVDTAMLIAYNLWLY